MLLENKVGIVSGVGPGIGRSIAVAFAREGADVTIVARKEDTLRAVAAEVEALGRRVVSVAADVTRPDDCRKVAEATQSAFGRIDILVNNAFLSKPVGPFAEADLEEWHRTFDVNFWGTLSMTRAVLPFMRELGDARLIMINASSARTPGPGYGAYSSSKSALLGVTRVLARELGPWGIRVNSVIPSATDTPNTRENLQGVAQRRGVDPQVVFDEVAATTALGYIPSPDEIAAAVVFFASPGSSAVTGQYLHVNGGSWLE
jgi:NAD(P)-dependent dehydrogenase (short-subunit alcohol dehydrogenase family)